MKRQKKSAQSSLTVRRAIRRIRVGGRSRARAGARYRKTDTETSRRLSVLTRATGNKQAQLRDNRNNRPPWRPHPRLRSARMPYKDTFNGNQVRVHISPAHNSCRCVFCPSACLDTHSGSTRRRENRHDLHGVSRRNKRVADRQNCQTVSGSKLRSETEFKSDVERANWILKRSHLAISRSHKPTWKRDRQEEWTIRRRTGSDVKVGEGSLRSSDCSSSGSNSDSRIILHYLAREKQPKTHNSARKCALRWSTETILSDSRCCRIS